jgi:hypothetical protein
MARRHDPFAGQLALGEIIEPSPATRRTLRRGPRVRRTVPPAARSPAEPVQAPPRALAEWHDMTPGERLTAWAGLRAWVMWLHDRYELGTEERLPRCWARHPGLVEELSALKAWREEIYTAPQPSGQAARYWHAELRQVLHAAATMYAAGCRTGHRASPASAAADQTLRKQWAAASPLAGIPGTELAARHTRHDDGWLSHPAMAAAIDAGQARSPVPGLPDVLLCAGRWWIPASAGWVQVADPGDAIRLNTDLPLPDDPSTRGRTT